jgi:hypothetical protein
VTVHFCSSRSVRADPCWSLLRSLPRANPPRTHRCPFIQVGERECDSLLECIETSLGALTLHPRTAMEKCAVCFPLSDAPYTERVACSTHIFASRRVATRRTVTLASRLEFPGVESRQGLDKKLDAMRCGSARNGEDDYRLGRNVQQGFATALSCASSRRHDRTQQSLARLLNHFELDGDANAGFKLRTAPRLNVRNCEDRATDKSLICPGRGNLGLHYDASKAAASCRSGSFSCQR